MSSKLQELTSQYLYWQARKEKDEDKLSPELMKKLKPYAKEVKLTKIRLKELNPQV